MVAIKRGYASIFWPPICAEKRQSAVAVLLYPQHTRTSFLIMILSLLDASPRMLILIYGKSGISGYIVSQLACP